MKQIFTVVLCLLLSGHVFAEDSAIDKELSDLATKLATLTKDNAKKKVTVLDFTDLQGGASELGKYIAEELTVNLVMVKKDFAVLDRANLRKILAEHKLTATGLVDPENAKKIGQFAGVDALILGTIVPKGLKVALTAKIITTDTAEIVGAAKSEFKSDETVQQLLSQAASAESATEANTSPAKPTAKPFGDLRVKIESFKMNVGDGRYGYGTLAFIITNASATTTYGVALRAGIYDNLNLSNSRGDEFKATEVSGIEQAYEYGNGFAGAVTDVPPKSAITVTSKSQVLWNGKAGEYRPYRLQTVIIFGEEKDGRHPNLRKYNLVLDIK